MAVPKSLSKPSKHIKNKPVTVTHQFSQQPNTGL